MTGACDDLHERGRGRDRTVTEVRSGHDLGPVAIRDRDPSRTDAATDQDDKPAAAFHAKEHSAACALACLVGLDATADDRGTSFGPPS